MASNGDTLVDTTEKLLGIDGETLLSRVEAQNKEIEQEVERQPLLSGKLPISVVEKDYTESNPEFLKKAKQLAENYTSVRKVRGDGNCFYRAIAFAELEHAIKNVDELKRFLNVSKEWKDRLINLGFPDFTTADFCDQLCEHVESIVNGHLNVNQLFDIMNDSAQSNYVVVFMRLVTSGFLQEHSDDFQGFIDGERTVKQFCLEEVDPINKECDHISVMALTKGLDIPIRIEYMDRCEGPSGGWHHDFCEEGVVPKLSFLYRPGHYDILYK